MQHVRVKSIDGWEERDLSGDDLASWFKDHTKDGIVTDEIVLFSDAVFKSEADGISWVMSDMSLDRDAERVDPTGADMKNYKKNPVVLWAHDTKTPAIGKVLNPRVKDGQVMGKVQFDTATNDPFAGMIEGKVRAGIIQAGSIGFKPNTIEFNEDTKDPTRLTHRKWELLEFSICNVPANSNAMAQASVESEEQKAAMPDDMGMRMDKMEKRMTDMEKRMTNVESGPKSAGMYSRLFEDRAVSDMFARSETSAAHADRADKLSDIFTQGGKNGS